MQPLQTDLFSTDFHLLVFQVIASTMDRFHSFYLLVHAVILMLFLVFFNALSISFNKTCALHFPFFLFNNLFHFETDGNILINIIYLTYNFYWSEAAIKSTLNKKVIK